jgi:tetratricopeptide (TPR) repeat protein
MKTRKLTVRSATFYDHLKQALELINHPATLGQQSPLATPYVLGEALRGVDATPTARGQALVNAINRAIEQLWGAPLPNDGQTLLSMAVAEAIPGGRYDCLVLELNYFKQRYRPAPKNQVEIYMEILHISRPTHDRHLRSAIERLGTALLHHLRPALHLEQPAPPTTMVGREALLALAGSDLRAGKTIGLTGHGGVGKTTLGAALANGWPTTNRFWYTFRPALNDQLDSLLFALGHFLHQRGASSLWHQLVVERGRIPGGLALGLARADLNDLAERPLLCFDELDLLYPLDQNQTKPGYLQILELIDGLRGYVPMIMIGQRAPWACDTLYQVHELTLEQLALWLTTLGIPHTNADLSHLHSYTVGNPRLIDLCVALYQADPHTTLSAVLEQLPTAQTLLPIWLRLERRLTSSERQLLQAISVFRSTTPADAWLNGPSDQQLALEQLIARRLVQTNERGGLSLLPALREVVYTALPVETREELHGQAATIRAERGEYTAAAYHLFHADDPEAAIDLWYAQREHEINQGQASAALTIFSQISQRRLSARHRRDLLLLRAELYELIGEPAQVVDHLLQDEWAPDDPGTPEAMLRLGRAIEAQGHATLALQTYQTGLEAVTTLLHKGTQIHVQRSLTNLRRREMQQAWQEALLARFHSETMLGMVRAQSGEYTEAEQHYLAALDLATQVNYSVGLAQSYYHLATLAGRRQDMAAALPYFEQAISFYQQIGDRVNQEIVRSNLASAFIQARQFVAAIPPAEQALRFFEAMGNSLRTAQNASNLAEAHAELGNLDEAQHYARLVLEQNEPPSHPYALYTLGTVYRCRGDWAQSERYYDQSRRIAEINDDTYLLAFVWRALGEVAAHQGQIDPARQAFAEARNLFERLNIPEEVRETNRIAAEYDA